MVRKTSFLIPVLALLVALIGTAAAFAAAPPSLGGPAGLLAPLSHGEVLDLPPADEHTPRPDAFLGYPLGSRFTSWDRIVAYFEALDAASAKVKMWEYGKTCEGRPLKLVAVSTPENLERLEEIRRDSLRLAEPAGLAAGERERIVRRTPVVVWLAYGVHGNETSSAEAAMGAAWALAAGTGPAAEMLKDVVVLIDPLQNPDGRERYVDGFKQRLGDEANPRRTAAEHFEPWPGGRQNHYVIDLNRDWAWASQPETRQRIAAYRSWEPQVYVDFHEMGTESSYFFPPPSEPINPQIDRRILGWLDTFGRSNAAAFDRQGWIYYKEENYDLFYPGYGDSYPSLRGAVGMTYEVAGGGRAGAAVALPDGSVLTLADRVARHLTTALATVRTAARNSRKLLEDFAANRARPGSEPGKTYLWPADQPEARALADLLAFHGVRVRQLAEGAELAVRPLARKPTGEAQPHRFAAGTYAVSTAQPLGNLITALLEIDSPMNQGFLDRQRQRLEQNLDAEFYDITAWSLPLAYNLKTWVAAGDVAGGGKPLAEVVGGISGLRGDGDLGWLVAPQGIVTYRLAAAMQRHKIHYRLATAPFHVGGGADGGGGASYPVGTLFIPRRANPEGTRDVLQGLLKEDALAAQTLSSSYEIKGLSLGSNQMPAVRPVRVGLVSGDGVDATSFGFLWFLLDRQVGVDHDRIDLAQLRNLPLNDYDVLILPSGNYDDRIGDKLKTALDGWIKAGGELVAIGDAVTWLQDKELTSIKRWTPPKKKDEKDDKEDSRSEDPEVSETPVEKQLASRPIFTPGAVLATRMQPQHPLTLGIASAPDVLYEGSNVLKATGDPRQDVLLAVDESPVVAGFAWPEAEQRLAGSLLVGTEPRGRGSVVLFVQDPAYRLFWRATAPIFLNAVLFGPSTGLGKAF